MTLYEVMGYGPVVADNAELEYLVTVNGAYFNVWSLTERHGWVNVSAYDVASRLNLGADVSVFDPLRGVQFWDVVAAAESLLAEIVADEEQEGWEEDE